LESIAKNDQTAGVRLTDGLEAAVAFVEPPNWATTVSGFRLCALEELPAGYITGWRYTIPIVDMPTYLGYLQRRLAAAGTTVEIVTVSTFTELAEVAPVVVNCAGMGAARLVPDPDLHPTRGLLVVVDNPGIECFFQEHDEAEELTYIFPQGNHLVLGGTAVPGYGRADHDPEVAEGILARCTRIEPRLAGVHVREHRVGFRPTREHVRVEWGSYDGQHVFHNYGHGGAGVTLSWGCAQEVVNRVTALHRQTDE
jgi:D-amino-acid oxidase